MKTLSLEELLRAPAKVKKLTAAGHGLRITDGGNPLWVLKPDRAAKKSGSSKTPASVEAFWRELDDMPPLIGPSTCRVLLEARR